MIQEVKVTMTIEADVTKDKTDIEQSIRQKDFELISIDEIKEEREIYQSEGMEDKIINAMKEFCKKDFMNRPDFDDSLDYDLASALTVFIADAMPDEDEASIYDFIKSKLR
jgi:hypothetical protein